MPPPVSGSEKRDLMMSKCPNRQSVSLRQHNLRELFLKSGNLCAFPGCEKLMMNAGGVFIGQVCHIEAAEEGGERFRGSMTNEQRRAVSNLMLMCYANIIKMTLSISLLTF